MNRYYLFLFLVAVLFTTDISAKKTPVYPVRDIPEELKENADVVIRFDEKIVDIGSIYNLKYNYNRAITILNKSGDEFAEVVIPYDKSRTLSNLQILIYDSEGMLIERVKSSEIDDYSASGESLFSDNRIKHYEPIQKNYPYTIVYSYNYSVNEYISIQGWHPYVGSRCSVQHSSFSVTTNRSNSFNYSTYGSAEEPTLKEEDNKTNFYWEAKNLKAYKSEPYSSPKSIIGPLVRCAPAKFQYDKIKGSTFSWNEFGKWRYDINQDRDILDLNTQAKIKEMVKDCTTDYEKVKTLYNYLQNKTRYISIQVGIGGWQAFKAQTVEEKAYGDCKALSNYMKALLKVIDIPSCYTIVNAGSKISPLDTNFVRNFTNHAILMVPLQQDTIWLECTDKFSPCGYLGSFTDDRTVLAINENGGELVRTPSYQMSDNTQNKTGDIKINADGTAKAKITEKCRGLQYEYIAGLTHIGPEDQKKKLYKDIDLPDFKINSFEASKELTRIPSSKLELDLDIRNYSSKSGDRLFVPLNLITRSTSVPKKIKNRKTNIYFKREYCDIDTIQFTLPEGYEMESIPEKKLIESDFGNYRSEAIQEGNTVSYIRKVEYKKFEFPAERYDELRNYKKAVARADKARMVLRKL